MKDNGYINILGWMITKLGLKGNELILYAMIYGFSQDGKSEFYGSYSYIASALSITQRSVQNLIKTLEEKGMILKTSESHYVAISSMEEISRVEKSSTGGRKNFHPRVEKISTNINTIYNNINNKSDSIESPEIESSAEKEKNKKIAEVIDLFKTLNTNHKIFFGNTTERKSSEQLLSIHSFEDIQEIITSAEVYNCLPYVPSFDKVYKPSDLLRNWQKIKDKEREMKIKQTIDNREQKTKHRTFIS